MNPIQIATLVLGIASIILCVATFVSNWRNR